MKRPRLSTSEIATLAISMGALVVSLWAVVESRQAAIQARRSEVRAEAMTKIERFRRSYSVASCVFKVGHMHSGQEEFKRFKSDLDELQSMLYVLQSSKLETLDAFEKQLDASTAPFGRIDDAIADFKLSLSSAELAKANEVCSFGG